MSTPSPTTVSGHTVSSSAALVTTCPAWLAAGLQAGVDDTPYYALFKKACPLAYTWQDDDIASDYSCGSITAFNIAFCPQSAALSRGDLNGDQCVDRTDARLLLANVHSPGPHHPAYDLNGDGAVDLGDVRTLIRRLTHPCGAPCP